MSTIERLSKNILVLWKKIVLRRCENRYFKLKNVYCLQKVIKYTLSKLEISFVMNAQLSPWVAQLSALKTPPWKLK